MVKTERDRQTDGRTDRRTSKFWGLLHKSPSGKKLQKLGWFSIKFSCDKQNTLNLRFWTIKKTLLFGGYPLYDQRVFLYLAVFDSNFFNIWSYLIFSENLVWRICSRFSTSFLEHDFFGPTYSLSPQLHVPKQFHAVASHWFVVKSAYQITLFSSKIHDCRLWSGVLV